MLFEVSVSCKRAVGTDIAFIRLTIQRDGRVFNKRSLFSSVVFSDQMSLTIGFRSEKYGTFGTLIRLKPGMGEDMSP